MTRKRKVSCRRLPFEIVAEYRKKKRSTESIRMQVFKVNIWQSNDCIDSVHSYLSFLFCIIISPSFVLSRYFFVEIAVFLSSLSLSRVYVGIEQVMRLEIYIVIFLQIEFIWAIRCYSCVGKIGRNEKTLDPCINPAENVGDGNVEEVECSKSKLCWKAIASGKIRRGCGEKRCAFIPDVNMGSIITQTCCANDLCNRTSTKTFSKFFIYFLLVVLVYLSK